MRWNFLTLPKWNPQPWRTSWGIPIAHNATPLFIPLKREHFEAFDSGDKIWEYRMEGPRWNEKTCFIGRPVTLSLGYGKRRRLKGIITNYKSRWTDSPAFLDCYGKPGQAACIEVYVIRGGKNS